MNSVTVGAKLAVQALLFFLLYPIQLIAVRFGWRIAGWVPVAFHRVFLWLFGVRVLVRGRPPHRTPTLVLANHVSWLDIAVFGSLRPLSFIAKSEVAGWPVVGLFSKLQRSVFIERARRTHTAKVNSVIATRLVRGEVMVLFAEGTTGDGNNVLPFRASLVGSARAALTESSLDRIDLQPLAIAYVRRDGLPLTRRELPEIAWYGDMDLAPHLAAWLQRSRVDVVVTWGEPIPFDAAGDRKRATAQAEVAVRTAVAAARAVVPGNDGSVPTVNRLKRVDYRPSPHGPSPEVP
jgi:1-acyl-sn-glycerol-3-phosphate acyltransferase